MSALSEVSRRSCSNCSHAPHRVSRDSARPSRYRAGRVRYPRCPLNCKRSGATLMALKQWVRLPTAWIEDRGLSAFRCAAGERSDNTAALMLLAVIAHHADDESGIARITYDRLGTATGLSRATISGGLSVLQRHSLIARGIEGRSTYQLCKYDPSRGWGKLPARHLYTSGEIVAFRDFHLRHRAELDALKLYYLFVARRNNATNLVQISYDKIDDYIGLGRHNIMPLASWLLLALFTSSTLRAKSTSMGWQIVTASLA
jgi:hypothetical protein